MTVKLHEKKDLHVRVDLEVYHKLKQLTFYQRRTLSEVVNRLLIEYLEEISLEEPELLCPPLL